MSQDDNWDHTVYYTVPDFCGPDRKMNQIHRYTPKEREEFWTYVDKMRLPSVDP